MKVTSTLAILRRNPPRISLLEPAPALGAGLLTPPSGAAFTLALGAGLLTPPSGAETEFHGNESANSRIILQMRAKLREQLPRSISASVFSKSRMSYRKASRHQRPVAPTSF
jgi:hypothetical protein